MEQNSGNKKILKFFIKLLLILIFIFYVYATIQRVWFKDDKNVKKETCLNSKDYVGECKNGKRHGQGTFTMPSGAIYVGEFKDDLFHGRGTITLKDGKQSTGIFKYGELREIINKNY
jgi:hypothetical protein